jgi:fumarate hydratase subunit beta
MRRVEKIKKVIKIKTPINDKEIKKLKVGDWIEIEGKIYCGRDAILPKLVKLIENNSIGKININLKGTVIFHTAVSPAGIGPTTSNKVEIEGSIPALSKAGVKIHMGKGSLNQNTINELKRYNSVFAITPPLSALFSEKMVSKRVVAFKEEGMEALYEIEVKGFPAIIAIAHGDTIFSPKINKYRDKQC